MPGRFGAAVSEHPLVAHATGEVLGQVLDAVGEQPDVAVVSVTRALGSQLGEICRAVQSLLNPGTIVGVAAPGVVGNQREVEQGSALSLWAGRPGPVTPVRLESHQVDGGWEVTGYPPECDAGTLVLVGDARSFPAEGFLEHLAHDKPQVAVVGGLVAAQGAPVALANASESLVLDGSGYENGAVGFALAPDAADSLVSQGCRPVGQPFIVTAAEGRTIKELGGVPARERLRVLAEEADDATKELLAGGVLLGLVVDESRVSFEQGDFLIRGLAGADVASGAVYAGHNISVGQTVQFQVRDASTASEDLHLALERRSGEGALLFTCNGRGENLFEVPSHDATAIYEALHGAPVGGLFCDGELGPVGTRNYVHGYTASAVLFK